MKSIILLLMISIPFFVNAEKGEGNDFSKTDEALSELVKRALVAVDKTGEFVIEQAPVLLQEFYKWHIAKLSLSIFISLLSVVCIIILIKRQIRWGKEENLDMYDFEYGFVICCLWVSFFIAICFCFHYIYDLIFIILAPKLYLIEYFVK